MANQLAMTGVNTIVLCDSKKVERSHSLENSPLVDGDTVGSRAEILLDQIARANPGIEVRLIDQAISMAQLDVIRHKEGRIFVFATIDDQRIQIEINRYCIMNEVPCMHSFNSGNAMIGYLHHPGVSTFCLECASNSIISGLDRPAMDDKREYAIGMEILAANLASLGLSGMAEEVQTANRSEIWSKIRPSRSLVAVSTLKDGNFAHEILKNAHMRANDSCLFCTMCRQNKKPDDVL